ncbi:MAG: CRISPR-associated protein CasA/Cse1 [Dehalococcoidia bacterium]|nr:MAG: CRISPR-associated protein CasA/Cse1 [Dehalococcoidia bacterium]
MPLSFNLLEEPWIPCVVRGEPRAVEYSLRDVLVRAEEILELADQSPLVTAALYRLLLAVLHRVFGPPTVDAWVSIWEARQFDAHALDQYFSRWSDRFDLFHPERPFYQRADLDPNLANPIGRTAANTSPLGSDLPGAANPPLFDHATYAGPRLLTPAEAARYVLVCQTFAMSGLVRKAGQTSAEGSHVLRGAVVLNLGRNLFETLMLNLVRYDGTAPFEFDLAADRPAWEDDPPPLQPDPPTNRTRPLRGYLDLLTWQARLLLLLPDASGNVPQLVRLEGWRIAKEEPLQAKETMLAFKYLERHGGQGSWVPLSFTPERALWRDATALLVGPRSEGKLQTQPPAVVRWVKTLVDRGGLSDDYLATLAAFGISADRSKADLWRREAFPLPLAYLKGPEWVGRLQRNLALSESAHDCLRRALWRFASHALAPPTDGQDKRKQVDKLGQAERERVDQLVKSFQSERVYWSWLDVPARVLIASLPARPHEAEAEWQEAVQEAARQSFTAAVNALAGDATGLRAAALTRPSFEGDLARLFGPSNLTSPASAIP